MIAQCAINAWNTYDHNAWNYTKQQLYDWSNFKIGHCYRCLHRFSSDYLLKYHNENYSQHTPQAVKMLSKNKSILHFSGIHLQHPIPFTIYADFESLLIPTESTKTSSTAYYTKKQLIISHVDILMSLLEQTEDVWRKQNYIVTKTVWKNF